MRRGNRILVGICVGLAALAVGAATGAGTAESAGGNAADELVAAEDYVVADFEPTEICVDHYLTRADGWSPIEVRVAEMDFTLWLDARG